ncbi:MFS transporter [Paenibacillus sp. Leaf72]|uniref:MFS transporter n=1 Tax=Paenibacillus sp. Leaf72 TaxID=1736234 RepID=UPI0006F80DA9|nr:MFS transporter [Paenibacillus sp. Leaf72]KQO04613.1 MFS transporter [Paenibacillus sp. Leaf72]
MKEHRGIKPSGVVIWRSPFIIQLLIIMFIIEFVKGALLISILPVYMGTVLGLSAYAIGWALALQYIGDNLFRSPIGWLIDRLGYRSVMLAGIVLTFTSVLLVAFVHHTSWIVVACLLLGIGSSPLWPCVITGATEEAGEEASGRAMSVVYVAWLVGVGAGPIAINFLLSSSYTAAFRLIIGGMIVVVLTTMFLPGRGRMKQRSGAAEEAAAQTDSHAANTSDAAREPLKVRASRYFAKVGKSLHASKLLYPAMFVQNFSLGLLTPILTLFARSVLHLTPAQYSWFLIAGGAITVLGLIPVGKFVDRLGTKWFLHVGFLLAAISLPLLGMTRSLPLVLVIVAIVGLGYACIIPAWNALIAQAIPKEERGAVWGFFLTIEGSGMVLGTILSGKLWDTFGHQAPFLVSGAMLLVLFVLHLFITRKQPVMIT